MQTPASQSVGQKGLRQRRYVPCACFISVGRHGLTHGAIAVRSKADHSLIVQAHQPRQHLIQGLPAERCPTAHALTAAHQNPHLAWVAELQQHLHTQAAGAMVQDQRGVALIQPAQRAAKFHGQALEAGAQDRIAWQASQMRFQPGHTWQSEDC